MYDNLKTPWTFVIKLTWLTRKTKFERQSLKNKLMQHWDNEHTFTKLFRVARKLWNGIKILCHHDKCFFPWQKTKKQIQSRPTMYGQSWTSQHTIHTLKRIHRNSFSLGAAWFNPKPNLCQAFFNNWPSVSLLLAYIHTYFIWWVGWVTGSQRADVDLLS